LIPSVQVAEHLREPAERHHFRDYPHRQIGELCVMIYEVLYEEFAGTPRLFVQFSAPILVLLLKTVEIGRNSVAKWAVRFTKCKRNQGSEIQFDHFKGFGDHIAKTTIK